MNFSFFSRSEPALGSVTERPPLPPRASQAVVENTLDEADEECSSLLAASTYLKQLYVYVTERKDSIRDSLALDERLIQPTDASLYPVESETVELLKANLDYAFDAYFNVDDPGPAFLCANHSETSEIIEPFVNKFPFIGGYFAVNHTARYLVIAFRGSDKIQAYYHNFQPVLTPWPNHPTAKVHQGFLASFLARADYLVTRTLELSKLYPGYQLRVVGQSLGGVHATMMAVLLAEGRLVAQDPVEPVYLFTYGRPRVGNKAFVDHCLGLRIIHYRVTNRNDLFSRIPFRHLGFVHENDEYWIDADGQTHRILGASFETRLGNIATPLNTMSVYWHNVIYGRSLWENPLTGLMADWRQKASGLFRFGRHHSPES
ncbi:hypothetical protein IWQ60_003879 [Tieghemiomyces parasiticus]|uniref:Fungal lipase-type domain-containing protein n=1 Tax=Tieghemiomyces parasiticus TaxID=78921 RepID=A0A9W8A9C8_9FUNG|nr:hypothetical protein IWQ60_003879 [Tieghemiomyces parasiticus]